MERITEIFERLHNLTKTEGQSEFLFAIINDLLDKNARIASTEQETSTYCLLRTFLFKIFSATDDLASEIHRDSTILISVKNQKILRTCFQLVTSIGISSCLIPGLGISLTKRCSTSTMLPKLNFTDEEKYELLVDCTNFFTRSYNVPVIKNIILTLHLSDYLAALIQLSFAPLKKPGTYSQFTMTLEMYNKLNEERKQFITIYEHLVANCFQPTLMKELLVLQSITEPPPPAFVKRVIAKEMSRRLLAPGGLLSLIRCFIESHDVDTGLEWKKIDMIWRLITVKHGAISETEYLTNISAQLTQILSLNNTHYLATALACVVSLNEKFPESTSIKNVVKDIFQVFDYTSLSSKANLPGTVILPPQEVNHKVNVLHACVCSAKLDFPLVETLVSPNILVLFLIGSKCTKNPDLQVKLKDILLKCLERLSKPEVAALMNKVLFEKDTLSEINIEEFDSGIAIKSGSSKEETSDNKELLYFLTLFNSSIENTFVKAVFEASLDVLINFSLKRQRKVNKDLLALEDDPVLLDDVDEHYATILQLLSEVSTSPKVVSIIKKEPSIVIDFIEHFISKENKNTNEECTSVALILLSSILSNNSKKFDLQKRFVTIVPILKTMAKDKSSFNHILCKEALSLMGSELPEVSESECDKAISNVFDILLPVRAHGIMQLIKLIDAKDPETMSKKCFIFCLFQEQLKDTDSYIYLSAVNGLAALCSHCPEDVLQVLCKEFLQLSSGMASKQDENKIAETRMKIGDVIVKSTKLLGEMAVVHKTVLLNTMLTACRDNDPLIRTSALSNLAEIALVLHYKIGDIIYELLLCVWGILEADKAIECRRAAVMVISSLLKGLGKDTLVQLKDNLLPIYRTLKVLYKDENEDSVVKLHAQIALEELDDIVKQFLFPELKMEKHIHVLDQPDNVFK